MEAVAVKQVNFSLSLSELQKSSVPFPISSCHLMIGYRSIYKITTSMVTKHYVNVSFEVFLELNAFVSPLLEVSIYKENSRLALQPGANRRYHITVVKNVVFLHRASFRSLYRFLAQEWGGCSTVFDRTIFKALFPIHTQVQITMFC